MLEVWLNRTREWLSPAEKLLPLPEQEFAGWALARLTRSSETAPHPWMATTICGDSGSGKSSLIRQALRQTPGAGRRKIVVADAVEWSRWITETSEFGLPAIGPGKIDVMVCENLDQLENPQSDGDRLASLLDQARQERIPVIVTSDGLPSQIELLSPRLLNRLQGGLLVGIRPLGEESQQRLLQLWSTQGLVSPVWLNRAINPLISTAGQLLQTATHPVHLSTHSVTAAVEAPENLSLELVAEMVAQDFQVPVADLCSGTRMQSLKIPRGVAMSLARELTGYPLTTIGRHFGCRSHTSVVRSCSRLQQLLPEAPSLRQQIQQLRANLRRQLSAECG